MKYKSALIILFLFFTSCKNALVNPYSKAPINHTSVWSPQEEQSYKLKAMYSSEEVILPEINIDNTLGDLFDVALNNNPSTMSTWADARAAAATYGENLSDYLPTIELTGQMNKTRGGFVFNGTDGNESFLINEQIQYGPIASLSFVIFDCGERRAKASKYFWALQQSNFLHNQNVQTVMKTVAESYYNYLSDEALYRADMEDLKDAKESYDAAKDKYEAGILSITDMLQAKTNYLQKKVNLSTQKNTQDNSYVSLVTALSIPADTPLQIKGFPDELLPSPFGDDMDELIKVAKACRGEYLAAKAAVVSSEKDLKMAKAELLPDFSFSVAGGQYWFQRGLTDQGNYNVALEVSVPIFTGFYYLNQIKTKRAQIKEAKAAMYSAELSIIEDVRTAMNDFISAKEKVKDTNSYLEAAKVERAAMFQRYKHGIVTILDLLSSQAYLADARSQYIVAQKEYYTSIISLSFATGVLSTQNTGLNL